VTGAGAADAGTLDVLVDTGGGFDLTTSADTYCADATCAGAMVTTGWRPVKEFGVLQRFGSASPTGFDLTGTSITQSGVTDVDQSDHYTADDVTHFLCAGGCQGYIEATLADCAGATQFTVSVGWGQFYGNSAGRCVLTVDDDSGATRTFDDFDHGYQTMGATSFEMNVASAAGTLRMTEVGVSICFPAYIICRPSVWARNESVVDACYPDSVVGVRLVNPTADAWAGAVEHSSDGGATYEALECRGGCTGSTAATARIVVDGDADGAGLATTRRALLERRIEPP